MGAEFAKTNFFFYSLRVTRSSSSIDRKAHCEGACLVVLRLKSFHDKLERAVLEFYAKCVQALKDLGRKIHNRRGPGDGIKILLSQKIGQASAGWGAFHGSGELHFALRAGSLCHWSEDSSLNTLDHAALLRRLPFQKSRGLNRARRQGRRN
jgi:hypothetical protein